MRASQIIVAAALSPTIALAQSTSPDPLSPQELVAPSLSAIDPDDIITFSEFPIGTPITSQYTDKGILFGGDSPFITTDGANPTSPVLSGTPLFQGSITGDFVDPDDPPTEIVVQSFSLDAGYFDELGSTRIEWFDPDGEKLGQRANSSFGIERLEVEGGNIASWRISIFANEPAGYAIDNVSITPVQSSVLFREKSGDDKDGTWGFFVDEIPGFDHVGLHTNDIVYESHPGYPSGTYQSADGEEIVSIVLEDGVQFQFTRKTFEHDSTDASTPVVDFEEIPISNDLADDMAARIDGVSLSGFQFIDFGSFDGIERTLSPSAQKGGNNTFTCVGLVEWAAEGAGHNGGQGFIRNLFESFRATGRELPLLSPQLLNYMMKGQEAVSSIKQWFQGLFDPVDFVVTDPLGRRLGFIDGEGEWNEIPGAFFSGDGGFEQIFLRNAMPGVYRIRYVGVGEDFVSGLADSASAVSLDEFLGEGEEMLVDFRVAVVPGGLGDANGDGEINEEDLSTIMDRRNTFTNDPNDPADINGDGSITEEDESLLEGWIAENGTIKAEIDILPGSDRNPVSIHRRGGAVPVAIFTTVDLDAALVDAASVSLAGAKPLEIGSTGRVGSLEDIDGDGEPDLLLRFGIRDLNVDESTSEMMLSGQLLDGSTFSGSDFVTIVSR